MNCVIAVIDGFDHGSGTHGSPRYENPANISAGVSVARAAPVLGFNYWTTVENSRDVRLFDPPGKVFHETPAKRALRIALKEFNSDDFEQYHYLLLHNSGPLTHTMSDGALGANVQYQKRLARAKSRFTGWTQQGGVTGPALQVIANFSVTNRQLLTTRPVPACMRARYRLDVTPAHSDFGLKYGKTGNNRYLYMQPGKPGDADFPFHLHDATTCTRSTIVEKISSPAGSLGRPVAGGGGLPLYAIGCTCRDFTLSALKADGSVGPSFYGCKHILFYNLCRSSGIANVITYPV
jgi:hypothetical protein